MKHQTMSLNALTPRFARTIAAAVTVWAAAVGAAQAQWVPVSFDARGVVYINQASIEREGTLRRFWAIEDFKSPDKDGDRSYRILWECDCKERRLRPLQTEFYNGPRATGERTGSRTVEYEWMHASPSSTGEGVLHHVCNR